MGKQNDLTVWLESPAGEKIPVGDKCLIGRAKDCNVVVNSEGTSRRHAMIYRQGEHDFWIADMGSANGTRLNGRHVSQHRRLADRDRIEVAGSALVFRQPRPVEVSTETGSPAQATIAHVRKFDCWLLVADIAGSTAMIRRLPDDEAAKRTGGLLTRWKGIVEAHKGGVNKFLGDGFLAYWPDVEGIAREVLGALDAFKRLQAEEESPFRLVLHYGQATSGGAPSLGEESLAGKEVYFAFRMEKLASSLGVSVLLSEAAAKYLGPLCKLEPQGRHGLAGFDGQFEFFSF